MIKGKLEIKSKIAVTSKKILAEVYTPGVARSVEEIINNKDEVYKLTIKNNTVAVVSDGSAVLGLGNVGAEASLPVMEGKCVLFKEFAGINAFPICLKTQETEKIVETIKYISPVFAAINLEDIAAPKCFAIEDNLQDLGIPVIHDDQHATAVIVLAGLLNAIKAAGKKLKDAKVVVCGAGAAGSAIIKLLHFYGCRYLMTVDSNGIIGRNRQNLPEYKKEIASITNSEDEKGSLEAACRKSDVLIGVSRKNLFSVKMIRSMNKNPIVFALANPDPEINRKDAIDGGAMVYANGRSNTLNQINNALVFPGFFKGLIKWRITHITNRMKVNAAVAIAGLIDKPTRGHFIPDIFERRLVDTITKSLRNQ